MPPPPPPMSDRVNVIHLRPVPVYRISTFVFLVLKVHFNQSQAFKFQSFGEACPGRAKKNLGHEAVRIFLGLNSSSPLLTHFSDEKLRSGPSTESFLGLVYTSSYCHTKPNIVKFGNGTAERHFDLYVEPVSNSIDLIVIYGVNIHAKFCGKFVKSNKMTPVHEQK